MARLGESNHPEHLAGEGNRGRRLAALSGRQGTYSAPASQLPSHAKTIARPKTIARTQDNQRQEAAPFEDSRRRQRSQDVYQCTGFGHRARPHTCHSRHVWLTWGRRLDKPAGRPLTPAGLRTAEVTARRGLQTPKARLPGGGARSRFAYGRDRQYSATQASKRREQGRPEGPPVRYPQGSDNRCDLAVTAEPP